MWSAAEIETDTPVESPENLVAVGDYATVAEAADRGLVILALGLCYWLLPLGGRFALYVERGRESAVRGQLEKYERESLHWPPLPWVADANRAPSSAGVLTLWALIMVGSFWTSRRWPALVAAGALEPAGLFGRGEWWRPFSALFLHGGVDHLLANALAGVFIFSSVLSTLGRRRGGLLLALGAYLGNLVSAAVHAGGAYSSIGASTAVFAGLGLLTGHSAVTRRDSAPRTLRSIFVPLGAGATLLALYGSGGQSVDLGAHLCGFAVGTLLGLAPYQSGRE